jgi:hypothetical protein
MMNGILCGYDGDREAMLMAYLYNDVSPEERASFEGHLATCARCRSELNALGGVRAQLATWIPPDPRMAVQTTSIVDLQSVTTGNAALVAAPSAWSWRTVPAWAQAAAAILVLGAAAGVANFDIRYDHDGLSVRTGWMKAPAASAANTSATTQDSPWRADLVALHEQLRQELRASQTTNPQPVVASVSHTPSSADADVMRRVKTLVDESERRQQNELALRVAEAIRELNLQRQADLRRVDQSLGALQDRTGVEVLRNRQKLDYILQRVSQQQ